jgi:hypothetical protein
VPSPDWKKGLTRLAILAVAVWLLGVSWYELASNSDYYVLFIRSCNARPELDFTKCMAEDAELRQLMTNQRWMEWALFSVGGPVLAAIIGYATFVLLRWLKRGFFPAAGNTR